MRNLLKFLLLSALMVMLAGMAQADQFTFTVSGTPSGGNQPASAQVAITTNNGSLTLAISNLISNPTAQGQIITGLQLNLTQTLTGAALQTSGSWTQLNFNTSPFSSTVTSNGWGTTSAFTGSGKNFTICAGPSGGGCSWKPDGIIGGSGGSASNYSNANPSITGNGNGNSHGTYLLGNGTSAAKFVVTASNVTSSSKVTDFISSVTVQFGTTSCTLLTSSGGTEVPEPASFVLFGTGLASIVGVMRRKLRA